MSYLERIGRRLMLRHETSAGEPDPDAVSVSRPSVEGEQAPEEIDEQTNDMLPGFNPVELG